MESTTRVQLVELTSATLSTTDRLCTWGGGLFMNLIEVCVAAILCALPALVFAQCDATFTVTLQTFGEGVQVELRKGQPGTSRVTKSTYSSGGAVYFSDLCAGNYFLAIGNEDQVSVTPVRSFESGYEYSSSITIRRGVGNVSKKSRESL